MYTCKRRVVIATDVVSNVSAIASLNQPAPDNRALWALIGKLTRKRYFSEAMSLVIYYLTGSGGNQVEFRHATICIAASTDKKMVAEEMRMFHSLYYDDIS